MWRGMTNQDERRESRKLFQLFRQLRFAVLTRRVEWRRTGVAEACDMILADLERLLVKILETVVAAKLLNLRCGFVIPRQDIGSLRAFVQEFSTGIQPAPPVRQITGCEIIIRLPIHKLFERRLIAVDIGENKELHDCTMVVG